MDTGKQQELMAMKQAIAEAMAANPKAFGGGKVIWDSTRLYMQRPDGTLRMVTCTIPMKATADRVRARLAGAAKPAATKPVAATAKTNGTPAKPEGAKRSAAKTPAKSPAPAKAPAAPAPAMSADNAAK